MILKLATHTGFLKPACRARYSARCRNDGAMSVPTQTRSRKTRVGRPPLTEEERVVTKATLPAWAREQFVALTSHTGMSISDLAGYCLVEEFNRFLTGRGNAPLHMPGYLAKQSAILPTQPNLLETPLFECFGVAIPGMRDQQAAILRFRLPRSVINALDLTAAQYDLQRTPFSAWLVLMGANQIRERLGMELVAVPSDLEEMVRAGLAMQVREARLVS